MNVSALSPDQLGSRLRSDGLILQTGQFHLCIRSSLPRLAATLHLLYADYPVAPSGGFADFHVRLDSPPGLRRHVRPQVVFDFDGTAQFAPLPVSQAFPMLEWGLNWCVSTYANLYLIIHAAVVEKNGVAAILPAPPGSGKSTLCAALVNRGWRLLSDELTLVRTSDAMIMPLPRPVSLKNASIDVMQAYEPAAVFSPRVFDTIKGTVAHMKPPGDCVARAGEPARAAWVVFPKYEAGAATRLEPISTARAFMRVADNCFNYSALGSSGFATATRLLDPCRCFDFTYSHMDEAIAVFDGLRPISGLG